MKTNEINSEISRRYNIARYGLKGMEVQSKKSGIRLKVFNALKTDTENWNEAVQWAKENINLINS